jgi:hypothetical protein
MPSPLTRIPVDGAEFVTAMMKGYGMGGPVRPHGIKGDYNLVAAPAPTPALGRVAFANKHSCQKSGSV